MLRLPRKLIPRAFSVDTRSLEELSESAGMEKASAVGAKVDTKWERRSCVSEAANSEMDSEVGIRMSAAIRPPLYGNCTPSTSDPMNEDTLIGPLTGV